MPGKPRVFMPLLGFPPYVEQCDDGGGQAATRASCSRPVNAPDAAADRYLDLLARALDRDLFLDEEVRNVDLRQWPGANLTGCATSLASSAGASFAGRRRRREPWQDWPSHIAGDHGPASPLVNVSACVTHAFEDGVPGDLVETGVWRGGACI